MAYENMTYSVILKRMMNRVSERYPNLDTREGSVIFNALAPAAVELAMLYTELDIARNESFVATASREYILEACKQMGMDTTIFDASVGIHKAEFNVRVPMGSRWNCDLYNYTVTKYIGYLNGRAMYQLQCETPGTEPNTLTGDLTPISDIPSGLTYAKLVECLVEGENETSDEDIRDAYYAYINNTASDGNINQYKRWCDEYDGIGNYKITPCWNGVNTVKVSILSSSNGVASDELISEFQEYLDPNTTGMGDGVAPIGAFVTVTTATNRSIDIQGSIKMKQGSNDTTAIDTALREYFTKIAYEQTTVGYMNIGAIILSVDGVESVSDLLVNGGTTNIVLGNEEIPTLGTATWVVS